MGAIFKICGNNRDSKICGPAISKVRIEDVLRMDIRIDRAKDTLLTFM